MHRNWLLNKLQSLNSSKTALQIQEFIKKEPRCFENDCSSGHVTGSAFLLNHDLSQVLLTHHKKLRLWLQLGGHCDGHPNVAEVALREAREESGIWNISFVTPDIVDVDIHLVPQRKEEKAHYHYDIRFFLKAEKRSQEKMGRESYDLKWFSPKEVKKLNTDRSVLRLLSIWEEKYRS